MSINFYKEEFPNVLISIYEAYTKEQDGVSEADIDMMVDWFCAAPVPAQRILTAMAKELGIFEAEGGAA